MFLTIFEIAVPITEIPFRNVYLYTSLSFVKKLVSPLLGSIIGVAYIPNFILDSNIATQ